MNFERSGGILLHPTSLPSKYGIGDLGKDAYNFIDFLYQAKQKLWQILPLNPTGYGESPYQCFSAFAGNPMLISIDLLMEEGLLTEGDIEEMPNFNQDKIAFERVKSYKEKYYRKAYVNYKRRQTSKEHQEYRENNLEWLPDFCFFMALKNHFHGLPWNKWEEAIAFREKKALIEYERLLAEEIQYQEFLQFQFYKQWQNLRKYANEKDIKIIGDIPIFVSYDSSDAWVNPHLFALDEKGYPKLVAGVPPDLFCEKGQLWGNPHFNWDHMKKDNYKWWQLRFEKLLELVDIIRIDHFRGFEAYWEIPAQAETAATGRWVKAPGDELFTIVHENLGKLPIIVEDLGFITPEVIQLKNKFQFPGMKILQFSFGKDNAETEKPHGFEDFSIVYTGTHDNETTVGWYKSIVEEQNLEVIETLEKQYNIKTDLSPEEVCWKLIEIAYRVKSIFTIIPLQDILTLDNSGRMNRPGTIGDNWDWRYRPEKITREVIEKLAQLVKQYNR
ncbi:4-alpha-glucanotransferase [Alkaliphilus transvaalensis]|uniref:4-alpha-glucanotransferase n=1 Tax=Alkaliphilus transvaalensis TaxID=114628 RepID=UPI00047ECC3E|nr:4-alpha-glucanotransferase [Alkaliphilus transvaalensis]